MFFRKIGCSANAQMAEISEKLPKVVCVVVPVLPEFSIWKLVTAFETSNPRYIGR